MREKGESGVSHLRAVAAILVAALVAYGAQKLGYPLEEWVQDVLGRQWLPWMSDLAGYFGIFVPMAVVALVLGAITRVRVAGSGANSVSVAMVGLVLGVLMVAVAIGVSLISGNAFSAASGSPAAATSLIAASAVMLMPAIGEELLFRGWLQPILTRYWGFVPALLVTALTFAGLHNVFGVNSGLVNFNLFLGGLIFGLLYRVFDGVTAPIFFHFGWNWADGVLFGLTPNPGRSSFGAIADIDLYGPAMIGGVRDGLMANAFATIVLLAIAATLIMFLRQRESAKSGQARKRMPGSPPSVVPAQTKPVPEVAPLPLQATAPAAEAEVDAPGQDETILAFGNPVNDEVPAGVVANVQLGTHQGCVRELNEDRYFADAESGIFLVADGMGGHKFGDRASTMIVEHVTAIAEPAPLDARVERVTAAIIEANGAIYAEAQTNGSRMGSTAVALMVDGGDYAVIWAGDSRAYRLRGGEVERLTKDHTQVQEMVDRGLLQPQDVARHPMSHVLVRAVGVNPELGLDEVRGKVEPGDVYFLCSDGIYDVLEEDEIAALLAKSSKLDAMEKMISMALDLGARDNVTGIIVRPE